ncbi:MAG TPA: triose-phosphate isomerase, partial [Deltaproteobacteria bacterium]|nr:triose-phosphate isomerase [Deltaproteobacteria bacterium]
ANSMHRVIRKELGSLASPEVADKMQILYGGSVNAENAQTLLSQSEIDGALVGGASLKTDAFPQIVTAGS